MAVEDSSTRVVALEETGWARLLFALLSQRFTGRAEYDHGGATRQIVFDGGFPVWADHEVPGTGVSAILAAAGMLSAEEAEAVLSKAPHDSLDALDVLLELDLADEDSATMALRDQCEQRLIATGGLGGEMTLHDDPGLPREVLDRLEPGRVLRVINRGIRGHCSPSMAEQSLEHLRGCELTIGRAFDTYGDRFGFDKGERAEVQLLAGRGSFKLDDLMEISGLDVVRSLQVLHTLWSCNMLVEAGSEPAAAASGEHGASASGKKRALARIGPRVSAFDVLGIEADATLEGIDAALDARSFEGEGESVEGLRKRAYAQRGMMARAAARKALADQRWKRAVAALRDLVALHPEDDAQRLDLTWAVWNAAERRGEREARALDEAITASKKLPAPLAARGQFYRGHLRRHQGRRDEARVAFERAAELDDQLLDAKREARALGSGAKEEPSRRTSGAGKRVEKPAPPEPKKSEPKQAGPRSKYWSGPWPFIWVLTGLLLVAMVAAQIILRLDTEL